MPNHIPEQFTERRRIVTHEDLKELQKAFVSCQKRLADGVAEAKKGYGTLSEKFDETLTCGQEQLREMAERLDKYESMIESVRDENRESIKSIEAEIRSKFSSLEFTINTLSQTSKNTDSNVMSMSNSINSSLNSLHDTVNIALRNDIKPQAITSKFDVIQKIPVAGWIAIAVVSIAVIAAIAGNLPEFMSGLFKAIPADKGQ